MGIPFFFHHIVKNNPCVVLNSINGKIDRLLLDFNSIIHMCSAAVVNNLIGDTDVNTLHDMIFRKIVDHTMNQIVAANPPNELLYIAIDGVAPLAKIHQQRKRRYLSAYRNDLINDFKRKNNIPIYEWDSNIITPGTSFMKNLDNYLHAFFETNQFPFKVIVSGSNESGEGEHKMIKFIKNYPKKQDGSDFTDVIYGLDADLIMLSLTCDKPRLYLMREGSSFSDIANNISMFKFLDIDRLRTCVAHELSKDEDISYMRDYVILCTLLGNDFIPPLPFLKIKMRGIDILKKAYTHVQHGSNLIGYCEQTGRFKLNNDFIKSIFEYLSSIENVEIINTHEEWLKTNGVSKISRGNRLEQFLNSMENFPHTSMRKKYLAKNININSSKWRDYYYHELFGDIKTATNTTGQYIKGIEWIVDYYLNSETKNTWFYEYGYAPTAMDIYMELFKENCSNKEINRKDYHITPEIQLAMVLPPSSIKKILPQFPYKDHKVAFMFPTTFKIEVYLKNFLWECTPILPQISIEKIYEAMEKTSV